MLEKQLAGIPTEERERLIKLVSENPELFQKIASEVQEKVKSGKDQMSAMMEVMGSHKDELASLMRN